MRIIGIDPGLQKTGWGIIDQQGNHVSYVACGIVKSISKDPLASRLLCLHDALSEIIALYQPTSAAIEETFVNVNAASTLKLGNARGAILLSLSIAGLPVSEYAATLVKKSIVGAGRADKNQIAMMVQTLLPRAENKGEDAMDALAIALCHAHHGQLEQMMA